LTIDSNAMPGEVLVRQDEGARLPSLSPYTTLLCIAALIPLIAFLLHQCLLPPTLPAHLLGHPVRYFPALLTPLVRTELINLTRALGELPGVSSAESSYSMTHEHIGEGFDHPTAPDGTCAHAFLVPSSSGKQCIFPGRIDVGRHYISTGGHEGLKEQHAQLINRVQSFIKYIFNPLEHATTARLFADEGFLSAARSVCPQHKPILDPFQTTLIAQVPGQTVPAHLDGVWFLGASRFHVPQWLLAVMAFSGLFAEQFVDQVQLVAYFHDWEDATGERGGSFVHWAARDGREDAMDPHPGSGNAMDGSKTVHAATLFEPSAQAPWLDKSVRHSLVYNASNQTWGLVSGGQPRAGHTWTEQQMRFSVVYRARCFRSEAERASFTAALAAREGLMDLESDILLPLMREAVRRRAAPSLEALQALPRMELGLKLLDTYVRYPRPRKAWLPFNYCALPRLFPHSTALARAIDWLCPLR
jgi:hypothetical protein